MTKDEAIKRVEQRAEDIGIPWTAESTQAYLDSRRRFPYLRKRGVWHVVMHSSHGSFWATVDDDERAQLWTREVWFVPRDENGWLLPLWLVHWGITSVSMFWRDSDYKYRWHGWWRTLTPESKCAYRLKYPEPRHEELGWKGFYDDIAAIPAEKDNIADYIFGRV